MQHDIAGAKMIALAARDEKLERFEVRVPARLGAEIKEWRRKQRDLPTRAEAVRRLIERGLEAEAERQL